MEGTSVRHGRCGIVSGLCAGITRDYQLVCLNLFFATSIERWIDFVGSFGLDKPTAAIRRCARKMVS